MKLNWSSVCANSSTKRSLLSRCSRHHSSSASKRRWASSSRTTFTPSAILPEILRCVHSTPSLGIIERAVERGMQRGSFVRAQIVVEHDDFDFGADGQVGGHV